MKPKKKAAKKKARRKKIVAKKKAPAGNGPVPSVVGQAMKRRHLFLLEKVAAKKTLAAYELAELRKLERGESPEGFCDTQAELARSMGVSTQTVENWIKKGCPREQNGSYNVEAIRAWRDSWDDKTGSSDEEYRKWRAKLSEVKYREAVGQLIPRDEVEAGRVRRILAVKERLLAIPGQVAPLIAGQDARTAQAILTEKIRAAIEAFSGNGANGGDGDSD